jgi:hypothetical protein
VSYRVMEDGATAVRIGRAWVRVPSFLDPDTMRGLSDEEGRLFRADVLSFLESPYLREAIRFVFEAMLEAEEECDS